MNPAWWLLVPVALGLAWWLSGRSKRRRDGTSGPPAGAPPAAGESAAPTSTLLQEGETQGFAPTTVMPGAAEDAARAETEAAAQRAAAERQRLIDEAERAAAEEQAALHAAYQAAEEARLQRAAEIEAQRQAAEARARRDAEEAAARQRTEREAAEAAARRDAEQAAERAAAEAAAAAEAEAAAAAPLRSAEQTLVMVVDDSKVVRVKTGRLLEKHRFRVAVAEDGGEALARIATERPDVVITDVEMPGVDGVELTRRLRAEPATAALPVIMITSADDRMREVADAVGVSVLLGKPYADEALVAAVAQLARVAVT